MTWPDFPLADLAVIQGGIQKQPKRTPRGNAFPFLRVANVTANGLDLGEVHSIELFDGELERYRLRNGDLLVVEGNGSPSQIGRASTWRGAIDDCVHQNHLIRVRPSRRLDARFLELVWNSPSIRDELVRVSSSTSGLYTLSVAKLKRIRVPAPPLDEQRRIVAILDGHLSHLDAANHLIENTVRRLDTFVAAGLWHATHDIEGAIVRLDSIAEVRLGRQRSPKNHSGSDMRLYLRAGNVDWDRLRLDDVKEMNFTELEAQVYELLPGDILVVEASGSAGEAGKSVIYQGEIPGACFQNTLLRVRTHSAQPEFVQKYLLADAMAGRFITGSRGVGINHIGRARLASWEVLVPSDDDQRSAVARVRSLVEASEFLRGSLEDAHARSAALRRSLLAAAFSGRLTGRSADTDVIEELASA